MKPDLLNVIAAYFNPLCLEGAERRYQQWAEHMIDSGVKLTVCELQYGDNPFVCDLPHVNHIGLRTNQWCWSKENLINIAFRRLPNAKYICWEDTDLFHRNADWAAETVEALQHYRVVQTWTQCLDMGPEDEVIEVHRAFGDLYLHGEPAMMENEQLMWKSDNGRHEFGHPGFSWACRREFLERTGGLFEVEMTGAADYKMATSLLGKAPGGIRRNLGNSYRRRVLSWQEIAHSYVNGRLGAVKGTIEHSFDGRKPDPGGDSRLDLLVRHRFDPDTDIKCNSSGIVEWAGNKPELERDWNNQIRARSENVATL